MDKLDAPFTDAVDESDDAPLGSAQVGGPTPS
jgi:hypothetical protein